MDAQMKQFVACKKKALAVGKEPVSDGARTAAELEACFGDDPKGKTAKACDKVRTPLAKKCVDKDLSLSTVFPDCASDDIEAVYDCIVPAMTCVLCRTINLVDDLALDCDLLDNGANDGSCP